MPKNFPRSERVEQQLREVLGEAISELKDPRIGFATVTSVRISPDLKHATVAVSALGSEEERATTIEAIQHAAPHLRSIVGREMRLKSLPFLELVEDTTAEQGERIEQLLRGLGVSKPPEVEPLEDPAEGS